MVCEPLEALGNLEQKLHHTPLEPRHHHAPTRHTPEKGFALFPHQRGVPLFGLSQTYTYENARTSVNCVPFFTQTNPMVFWTDREHRIPHAASAMHQMPVCVELIRQLNPQVVVTTPEIAPAIETALAEQNVKSTFSWHIIGNPNAPTTIHTQRRTYRELHPIPGLSAAYQCPHLTNQTEHFHVNPAFTWKSQDGILIASHKEPGAHPFPLEDFPLFKGKAGEASCPCGEAVYSIEHVLL